MNTSPANTEPASVAVTVRVRGDDFVLLPHHAVYWPARRVLMVADLHLGKGESLRALGAPLSRPAVEGVLADQFGRLRAAVEACSPARLLILGDVIHAGIGLTPALVDTAARELEQLRVRTGVRLAAVRGNHDRRLPDVCGRWCIDDLGVVHDEAGFLFRHDPPAPADAGRPRAGSGGVAPYVWCGHLHPSIRLRNGIDAIKLPCFVLGEDVGILPAFTCFTSGLSMRPTPTDRVYAGVEDRVLPV